ncbi:MAG TPA: hypothetical protein VFK06_04670 [Candidatus Angelobacter sp.]|nr:hypothetical protein [Candidatus Angelobacter sp.]
MKRPILISLLLIACCAGAQIDTRVVTAPVNTKDPDKANSSDNNSDKDKDKGEESERSRDRQPALSGLETLRRDIGHDTLSFSGQLSGLADSNARQTNLDPSVGVFSQFGGLVQFQHTARSGVTTAEYSGGSTAGGSALGQEQSYQEVGATQTLSIGRWHLLGGGHFTYLPESAFGFNSVRAVPDANAAANAGTGQTIFTQAGTQINRALLAQGDLNLNRFSSITMLATYQRQTFDNQGLLNTSEIDARFGYNRILSSRRSVAVAYSFGQFDFDNTTARLQTHSIQFFLSQKLSQNTSFKVSLGPQIMVSQGSVAAGTGVTLSGNAELDYKLGRTQLDFSYSRQTTGGSGVFTGSLVNQVMVLADRRINRIWDVSTSVSYAHTGSLEGITTFAAQTFDAVYATSRVNLRLTRNLDAFLSYGIQVQGFQTQAPSVTYPARHLAVIGLMFHPRPLLLRH